MKRLNPRKMRLAGLTGLAMMTSLLIACSSPQSNGTVPKYSADFLRSVAKDYKTCGPAAKDALRDWEVMIGL